MAEIKNKPKPELDEREQMDLEFFDKYNDFINATTIDIYKYRQFIDMKNMDFKDLNNIMINDGLSQLFLNNTLCILQYNEIQSPDEIFDVDKLVDGFSIFIDFTNSKWIKDGYKNLYRVTNGDKVGNNHVDTLMKNNLLVPDDGKANELKIKQYFKISTEIIKTEDKKIQKQKLAEFKKLYEIHMDEKNIDKLTNNEFIIVRLLDAINHSICNFWNAVNSYLFKVDNENKADGKDKADRKDKVDRKNNEVYVDYTDNIKKYLHFDNDTISNIKNYILLLYQEMENNYSVYDYTCKIIILSYILCNFESKICIFVNPQFDKIIEAKNISINGKISSVFDIITYLYCQRSKISGKKTINNIVQSFSANKIYLFRTKIYDLPSMHHLDNIADIDIVYDDNKFKCIIFGETHEDEINLQYSLTINAIIKTLLGRISDVDYRKFNRLSLEIRNNNLDIEKYKPVIDKLCSDIQKKTNFLLFVESCVSITNTKFEVDVNAMYETNPLVIKSDNIRYITKVMASRKKFLNESNIMKYLEIIITYTYYVNELFINGNNKDTFKNNMIETIKSHDNVLQFSVDNINNSKYILDNILILYDDFKEYIKGNIYISLSKILHDCYSYLISIYENYKNKQITYEIVELINSSIIRCSCPYYDLNLIVNIFKYKKNAICLCGSYHIHNISALLLCNGDKYKYNDDFVEFMEDRVRYLRGDKNANYCLLSKQDLDEQTFTDILILDRTSITDKSYFSTMGNYYHIGSDSKKATPIIKKLFEYIIKSNMDLLRKRSKENNSSQGVKIHGGSLYYNLYLLMIILIILLIIIVFKKLNNLLILI